MEQSDQPVLCKVSRRWQWTTFWRTVKFYMTDKNSGYDNIYKSVTLYSLSIFQIKTVFLVVLQSGNAVLICAIRKINRKKV